LPGGDRAGFKGLIPSSFRITVGSNVFNILVSYGLYADDERKFSSEKNKNMQDSETDCYCRAFIAVDC